MVVARLPGCVRTWRTPLRTSMRAPPFLARLPHSSATSPRHLHTAPPRPADEKPFPSPQTLAPNPQLLRITPAPPRLPAAEQAEFERLQQEAAARLEALAEEASSQSETSSPGQAPPEDPAKSDVEPETGFLHTGVIRPAEPEFEGDVNPKTGEVGGPKNEPLRWGATGDWSYNGRVTDF